MRNGASPILGTHHFSGEGFSDRISSSPKAHTTLCRRKSHRRPADQQLHTTNHFEPVEQFRPVSTIPTSPRLLRQRLRISPTTRRLTVLSPDNRHHGRSID